MITLNKKEWEPIWNRIKTNYPKSVWLLSYKLKETLGFTIRTHQEPVQEAESNLWYSGAKVIICLDFYDEQLETLFRLKYL